MFFRKSKKNVLRQRAEPLARAVLDRAVLPWPYQQGWVADTLEARMDWSSLHGAVLVMRLSQDGGGLEDLAEPFSEALFSLYDYSIRETGVGDSSIARKIRKVGEQYAGLGVALSEAFFSDVPLEATATALRKNGIGGRQVDAVAAYAVRLYAHLSELDAETIEKAGSQLWPEFHVD